jgi:hypothetical protein
VIFIEQVAMIDEVLRQASQELMLPSESDYPFEPFVWAGQANEPLTSERLLQLTGHPPDVVVEVVDLNYLFRNVAEPKEWHDSIQQANVVKFQALAQVLTSSLSDVKVYRVGAVEIDVYIVGKHNHDLAGLATKAIET